MTASLAPAFWKTLNVSCLFVPSTASIYLAPDSIVLPFIAEHGYRMTATPKRRQNTASHTRKTDISLSLSTSIGVSPLSDHPPIISLAVKLVKPKKGSHFTHPYNDQQLSEDTDLQGQYNMDVTNRFHSLEDLPGYVESQWPTFFCSAISKSANKVVGCRSNIRQLWLSEDTFNLPKLKSESRLTNDNIKRQRLLIQKYQSKSKQ